MFAIGPFDGVRSLYRASDAGRAPKFTLWKPSIRKVVTALLLVSYDILMAQRLADPTNSVRENPYIRYNMVRG